MSHIEGPCIVQKSGNSSIEQFYSVYWAAYLSLSNTLTRSATVTFDVLQETESHAGRDSATMPHLCTHRGPAPNNQHSQCSWSENICAYHWAHLTPATTCTNGCCSVITGG